MLIDTGKPRKTCVEVAGHKTFRHLKRKHITNGREDVGGGKDLTGGIILVAYFGKGPTALLRCFGMTPDYVTADADVRPVILTC